MSEKKETFLCPSDLRTGAVAKVHFGRIRRLKRYEQAWLFMFSYAEGLPLAGNPAGGITWVVVMMETLEAELTNYIRIQWFS